MSQFHVPQTAGTAPLSISSPRSLRPREQIQSATPRFYPASPATLPRPGHVPDIAVVDEFGQRVDRQGSTEESSPEYTEQAFDQGTQSSWNGGFIGSLVNGLRRIPAAMAKHHSRESMYSEYVAEAGARAARESRRFANAGPSGKCR
jgi:hypothetical protein